MVDDHIVGIIAHRDTSFHFQGACIHDHNFIATPAAAIKVLFIR